MGVLVNLWTQVRKQLRWANGGTGNTQGWSTGVIKVCTNRTGSTIALNTLVKLSGTYNDARVTPTTSASDKALGIVVGYWATDDMPWWARRRSTGSCGAGWRAIFSSIDRPAGAAGAGAGAAAAACC